MNKELINLFKKDKLNLDEYLETIIEIIPSINKDNIENLEEKYLIYCSCYDDIYNGENKITVRFLTKNINNTRVGFFSKTNLNIKYWLDRGWNEEYSNQMIKKRQSTNSVEFIKNKYGEDVNVEEILSDRKSKWLETTLKNPNLKEINYNKTKHFRKEFILKTINPSTNELYTEEEVKLLFLKNYGWLKDKKMTIEQRKTNYRCIEYWLNKNFTIDEASDKISEIQSTFSLEKCISKYGEEQGIVKWRERQEKWQNNLNSKTDEEKLEINRKKISRNTFYSNESIIYFDKLIEDINKDIIDFNYDIYYKDNEYYLNNGKNFYLYDFTIPSLKIIIEYNGSHVHPNRDILTEDEWNKWTMPYNRNINADIAYEKDEVKKITAINKGFEIYYIWDTDNKKLKNKEFIDFIKNKINFLIKK